MINTDNIHTIEWYEVLYQTNVISDPLDDYEKQIIAHRDLFDWWHNSNNALRLLNFAAYQIDRRLLVYTMCQCIRLVLCFAKSDQSRIVIEKVEKWCRDEVSIEEVREVIDSAHASYDDYVSRAVFYFVETITVAYSADSTNRNNISNAIYYATCATTDNIDQLDINRQMSDIIRKYIPMPSQIRDEWEKIRKLKVFI